MNKIISYELIPQPHENYLFFRTKNPVLKIC